MTVYVKCVVRFNVHKTLCCNQETNLNQVHYMHSVKLPFIYEIILELFFKFQENCVYETVSAGCWGKSHIELYLKLEKNVFKLGETIKVRDLPKAKVFGLSFSVCFYFAILFNHYNVFNQPIECAAYLSSVIQNYHRWN